MPQWSSRTLARDRNSPAGFILPCQPTLSAIVPRGPEWVHELKHDGWRIIARKSGPKVRLWTRQANEQTYAFRAIVPAIPVNHRRDATLSRFGTYRPLPSELVYSIDAAVLTK